MPAIMRTRYPKFHGLRVYLISTILYFFLVLPFIGFLALQNVPEKLEERFISDSTKVSVVDSLKSYADSLLPYMLDTMVMAMEDIPMVDPERFEEYIDSITTHAQEGIPQPHNDGIIAENKTLNRFFNRYFKVLFIAFILGLFFNLPFKRYLKRKRRLKEIKERHAKFCKRVILKTPLINTLILFLPHLVSHVYGLSVVFSSNTFTNEVQSNIFQNFLYVSVLAAFLTLLFAFFWLKNRVHLRYLEFFFSEEDLRKRIFRSRSGKIRKQLWFASVITTFFPLAIVVLYFILSLTSVRDLQLGELSIEQKEVLLGTWHDSVAAVWDDSYRGNYENLFYVNAVDSIIMFIGIGTGIFISIFYLFLIVKWTTRSIVYPVTELLGNMKKIRKDGVTDYTIVRTNDEVGELAEGFNVMIHKIKNYIASISEMNKDLEKKVIQRTREIADQKEEIEAQKEEIESQLEMVTSQKDTIEGQQYQILDSIHYAKRIQTAILPPKEVLSKVLSDHFVLYKPRDIVSGDFFWVASSNSKIYIAVADCTGHGVPGAFLSILGISFLNEIINKEDIQNTSSILGQLRKSLISSLHQKGDEGEAQDGMEVALCMLDFEKQVIQYSGANRPLYLLRKAGNKQKNEKNAKAKTRIINQADLQLSIYKPDAMPIGIYDEHKKPFEHNDIPILPGDSIYLFTDGYVDQMGGPDRKTFRVKYFRELLFEIQEKGMKEQEKILEQKINEWRGDFDQTDDILVLGMKI